MQRITVTVDDEVARVAKAEVKAGKAESVSAWVSDAMRRKAAARAELIADLDAMARERPTTPETVAWVAAAIGRDESWVAERLGVPLKKRRSA